MHWKMVCNKRKVHTISDLWAKTCYGNPYTSHPPLKMKYSESQRDRKRDREREEDGGTEGVEGYQDQAGRRVRTGSGGNNDMKELSWRSHTALAHLRRHKIP